MGSKRLIQARSGASAAIFSPLPSATDSANTGQGNLLSALKTPHFIAIAIAYFFCCGAHSGPIFHTISYAIGCGLSALTAVTIYSVEGFAGLVGRLVFGVLGDKLGVKRMIVAGLLVQAVAAGSPQVCVRLTA